MTDMQLLTLVITLLAIFAAMYGNRKSVEDMRDVLRAEWKAGVAEIRGDLKAMSNQLDHLVDTQASHGERISKIDREG